VNIEEDSFIDDKIAELQRLHIVFLQMLGIPCSREYLPNLGLQMVGPFFVTLHYLIGAFPFWCELHVSWIFDHQAHFPEDPVPDSELPGAYCLVEVPSRSIMIVCPGNLIIISSFFSCKRSKFRLIPSSLSPGL
jgi:hypothetical protein